MRTASTIACLLACLTLAFVMIASSPKLSSRLGLPDNTPRADTDGTPVRQNSLTAERADRNEVWALFNRRCQPAVGDSTGELEMALCETLLPSNTRARRTAALADLKRLRAVDFDDDQLGRLATIFDSASTDTRIGMMRGLIADSANGIRIANITVNRERMTQFLWGETISTEK